MSQRIPRLEMADFPAELAAYLAPRVKRLGYLGEFFKCAGNAPEVLLTFMQFTEALKKALPDKLTEVVALSVAGLMGNRYELHQHERLSFKLGFGKDWVAALDALDPDHQPKLSEVERLAQNYTIAAVKTHGRSAAREFEALANALIPSEAVAVVMLIGRYMTHAVAVNTLQLKPPVPSIFDEAA